MSYIYLSYKFKHFTFGCINLKEGDVLYMYIRTYVLYFNKNAVLTWTHVLSEPNLIYYYHTSVMIYYIITLGIYCI